MSNLRPRSQAEAFVHLLIERAAQDPGVIDRLQAAAFAAARADLLDLRKGDLITVKRTGQPPRLMVVREAATTDGDVATFALDHVIRPVSTTQYPDPIPREDQDPAHARCAPDRGAEVPADQVRAPRDTTGGRDGR